MVWKNAKLSSISSFVLVARREEKSRRPQRKEALGVRPVVL